MDSKFGLWFSIIRPRTLPASVAGVVAGSVYAWSQGCFVWFPALAALIFAVSAQIASNLANDYFDFLKGADGEGRVGPKRSLATGEVSPKSMVAATAVALVIAALSGLSLLFITGKYWLLGAGIVIVLAALAYSGGPYPLSRHALGDVAVVLFFGLVSVCSTYYVQALVFDWGVLLLGLAVGLVTDNILVVNNYRDMEQDAANGKHTLVTEYGRRFGQRLYYWNGVAAMFLAIFAAAMSSHYGWEDWLRAYVIMSFYLLFHTYTHRSLKRLQGTALNPLLGRTARNLLVFVALFGVIVLTDIL